MQSAWKSDGVFYYVSSFLSFTHIVPWMSSVDLVSYLAIFYICVGFVVVTILAFVYVHYSSTRIKTAMLWPQQLLRGLFFLITTVLFIPFLGKSYLLTPTSSNKMMAKL